MSLLIIMIHHVVNNGVLLYVEQINTIDFEKYVFLIAKICLS